MKQKLNYCYCTWFYSGLAPKAPGTVGTFAAIPFWYLIKDLNVFLYLLIVALMFVFGVLGSSYIENIDGIKDQSFIVIDEVVGFLLAAVFVQSLTKLALAFVIFRLFDIFKPWPISWADQKVGSGLGVMLDDVFAGLATFLVLLGF